MAIYGKEKFSQRRARATAWEAWPASIHIDTFATCDQTMLFGTANMKRPNRNSFDVIFSFPKLARHDSTHMPI
jgi:hypothetical protein